MKHCQPHSTAPPLVSVCHEELSVSTTLDTRPTHSTGLSAKVSAKLQTLNATVYKHSLPGKA